MELHRLKREIHVIKNPRSEFFRLKYRNEAEVTRVQFFGMPTRKKENKTHVQRELSHES